MRLIEARDGSIVDLDAYGPSKKCPVCGEWFLKSLMSVRTYCGRCWYHYQKFRKRRIAFDEKNGNRIITDTSMATFRDLYLTGMLRDEGMVPWTWPGETEVPPGALS
jgi:ribosomal protein S27AE